MPVKKTPKKSVSQKKRKEIHEAANSISGLLIEHVSFDENSNDTNREFNPPSHKYMLSAEKRREHQKKRFTVFVGVGTVILALCILWFVNIRTFFFDSKFNTSTEEQLLSNLKQNFENTVGLVGERPTTLVTTTRPVDQEQLKAALIAGLLASSTTSTASSTVITITSTTTSSVQINSTSTTSTP